MPFEFNGNCPGRYLHSEGLWAITAFFNPLGYSRRLENFRVFSKSLKTPLLAVELGYDNKFSLQKEDADILLRIPGSDIMWQKERLLNLAVEALPNECDKVAWLDCDIIFDHDDWQTLTANVLEKYPLAQLFQNVHYLDAEWRPGQRFMRHKINTRPSLASGIAGGSDAEICLVHPSPQHRPGTYANGMAWAARRDLLDQFGFYDACIIGGGDRAISSAAYGCFEHLRNWHDLNQHQWAHYFTWAKGFHEACRGKVGVVEIDLYHQWHGKASDRGLGSRHDILKQFDFDPSCDVAIDKNGCWSWSSDKTGLHHQVHEYFRARQEDG
jgi:hypothetical protein